MGVRSSRDSHAAIRAVGASRLVSSDVQNITDCIAVYVGFIIQILSISILDSPSLPGSRKSTQCFYFPFSHYFSCYTIFSKALRDNTKKKILQRF